MNGERRIFILILFISGDISIALTDTKNQDLPFTIDDNQDGTFTIAYTPKVPGVHCISVLFGDNEIPISPLKVNVEPSIDVNKIHIEGLETRKSSAAHLRVLEIENVISLVE